MEILPQNFLEGHALQLCGVGTENLSIMEMDCLRKQFNFLFQPSSSNHSNTQHSLQPTYQPEVSHTLPGSAPLSLWAPPASLWEPPA